jgi:hypothetical protein
MMDIKITPTTYNDCLDLAETMRKSDVEEIYASNHYTPKQALLFGLNESLATYTVRVDDEIVMIYGVGKLPFVHGAYPWMLAAENIEKYGVAFYRYTINHIDAMLKQYGYLENYVDCRNKKSIRWLKWLGFNIEPAEPYGLEGEPFHRFWKTIK